MRVTLVLFWLAVTLWFAAAAAPGAAAVSAFTTTPHLGASIPALEGFFQGDSHETGRYIAGRMLQPLFDGTDWVQISAAAMAVTTALRIWRLKGFTCPPWLVAAAVVIVLAAAALLAVRLSLATGMRANLGAYWGAIEHHDRAAAQAARALFDADHRVAERLATMQALLLLAAVAACAVAFAPATPRAHAL